MQLSAKSTSSVAASDLPQSQHQTQTDTASPRKKLSSVFLSCLHLPSLHSSFCHALLYSFCHQFLSFFFIFSGSYGTAFNFLNISLTSAPLWFYLFLHKFLLLLLLHLLPSSSFFIFSLALILFTVITPRTHILAYHMAQMHMVFRSDHI